MAVLHLHEAARPDEVRELGLLAGREPGVIGSLELDVELVRREAARRAELAVGKIHRERGYQLRPPIEPSDRVTLDV